MSESTPPPAPTLTVAAVARRLGVAPPTLRTWDRRYGLGPSAHTAGAHRRYSPGDVARLMVMRRLTLEGVSPADAAAIAIATQVSADGRPVLTPAEGYDRSDLPGPGDDSGGRSDEPVADAGRRPVPPRGNGPAGDRAGRFADESQAQLQGDVVDLSILPEPMTSERMTSEPLRSEPPLPGTVPPESTPSARPFAGRPDDGRTGVTELFSDTDPWADTELFSDPDLFSAGPADSAAPNAQLDSADVPWRDEPGPQSDSSWPGALRAPGADRSGPGGGRIIALPDGTPASRGLARAAMSLDTYETNRLLREAIRKQGVIAIWNSMITPVLRALGERTAVTGDGIDVEHAFSEVILGVMRGATLGLQHPGNTPSVLLACADSDYHSLPLHALAAALAEREIGCRMLGSGLPPGALSASVRRTGPAVVVLFARMLGADAGGIQELRRQRPAPAVILAGPGWQSDTVPPFARTASSLTEAIDEVVRALHA